MYEYVLKSSHGEIRHDAVYVKLFSPSRHVVPLAPRSRSANSQEQRILFLEELDREGQGDGWMEDADMDEDEEGGGVDPNLQLNMRWKRERTFNHA